MSKQIQIIIFFLSLLILLAGCSGSAETYNSWFVPDDYFRFYSLDQLNGKIDSGWIEKQDINLWTWSLTPENYTQTVVVLHGYLDHSALSLQLLEFLNKKNFRIITYDLPGHGRSGGERGGLNDFSQYSDSLKHIMTYWNLEYEETIFIGHSTGCSIILDALIHGQCVKGAVLAAPLIQFRYYDMASSFLEYFMKGKSSVAVRKKESSNNKEFNSKKSNDPMRIERVPLNWPRAIIEWNESLPDHELSYRGPVLILQGEQDSVVFYERNLVKIKTWFPHAQIIKYPPLMHHILNEKGTEALYDDLSLFLESLE